METTRILWNGLTGKTGRVAIPIAKKMADVKIVAGISRNDWDELRDLDGKPFSEGPEWLTYDTGIFGLNGLVCRTEQQEIDIIIDFSHPDVFGRILELAVRTKKPLIVGISGLSNRQMATLYDATNHIPIFRGGNFHFKVKKFIDESVQLAMNTNGGLTLYENFYKGANLPSESSKVMQRRIGEATSKTVEVDSQDTFNKDCLICDWRLVSHHPMSPSGVDQGDVHCRIIGFEELAHDVLEIAKVMAKKPVKKGEFYTLDELWDDLVL